MPTTANPMRFHRLAGIADKVVSADKVEAAVAAYATCINHENRERRIQADADARALAKVERAVAVIMAAIEDGLYQPTMKARVAELEREKAEITARLVEAPPDIPDVHRSEKRGEVHATLLGSLMGILDFVGDTPQPRGHPSYNIGSLGFSGMTAGRCSLWRLRGLANPASGLPGTCFHSHHINEKGRPRGTALFRLVSRSIDQNWRYCSLPTKPILVTSERLITARTRSTTS